MSESSSEPRPPVGTSPFFYAGAGIFHRQHKSWWTDFGYWDFDGFDGFPPFLPIFVFEPLHVWDWRMASTEWSWVKRTSVYAYRAIPLRWSSKLLVRTYLRTWIWLPLMTGLLFTMSNVHWLIARLAGLCLCGVCVAGVIQLRKLNHRDRQIRFLLGKHRLGTSDPIVMFTWLFVKVANWFRLVHPN